jgi:hypothetical protein
LRNGAGPDNDPFFPTAVFRPPERGRRRKELSEIVRVDAECGQVQVLLKAGDVHAALSRIAPIVRAHASHVPNGLLREVYVAALELRPETQYAKRIVYRMLDILAERLAEITSSHGIQPLFSVTMAEGYERIAKRRFAN